MFDATIGNHLIHFPPATYHLTLLLPNGGFCQFLVKKYFSFPHLELLLLGLPLYEMLHPGVHVGGHGDGEGVAAVTRRSGSEVCFEDNYFLTELPVSAQGGKKGRACYIPCQIRCFLSLIRPCKVVSDCLRKADLLSFPLHVPPFKKEGKGTQGFPFSPDFAERRKGQQL